MTEEEKIITIEAKGRDKGKVFIINVMDAYNTEMWALKVIFELMNTGVELPENLQELGFAGLFSVGAKAFRKLKFADAKPLLDEIWDNCLWIKPSESAPKRRLVSNDILEVKTRLQLRLDLLRAHTDFYVTADQ